MTLSDLESLDARGQTFPEDLCGHTPIVWPRTTKFATVTPVEMGMFLRVRCAPLL